MYVISEGQCNLVYKNTNKAFSELENKEDSNDSSRGLIDPSELIDCKRSTSSNIGSILLKKKLV